MKRYVNFIFSHKKPLFILFGILNLAAIFGLLQIRLNTDFTLFTTNDSPYEDTLKELEVTFGSTNQIIVMVEITEFSEDNKTIFREIQSTLEDMDHVEFVQGPAPEVVQMPTGSVAYSDVDANTLWQYYGILQEFSPIRAVEHTGYGLFTVFLTDDFNRQDVQYIEDLLGQYSLPSYIAGDQYNQMKVIDYIIRILFILPPLAVLIILAVFRWQIGAFKPTILSVLPAAIGSLWTFGVIGYLGNEVSILTAVVPIFIIVIGSADGLHFMTHYQESLKEGMSKEDAMTKTLKVVGIAMIITTLTSMAGFMSLLSMNTDSIVDLAVFAALGIFLAGVATWYVLPLILTNNIDVLPKKEQKFHIPFALYLRKLWGLPSYIFVALIVLLTALFMGRINHEFDMLSVYKNYTVVAKNADKLQEVNGGSIPLYIMYESDDIISIDAMDEVDGLINELEATGLVNHVINPYRILEIMYDLQVGGDIPNDFALTFLYNNVSSNSDLPLDSMFSEEHQVVRLLVFPSNMENATLTTLENTVNDNEAVATITGAQFLLKDLNVSISLMQRNSILLAIGIVFIMLLISLKDFKIALFSIVPITITVGAIYAVLGMTGISLNITTVIIFSISIGVGIDYAVHFSSVYKLYFRQTKNVSDSLDKAYQSVSKPIIANALGVSLGLSALMFSPLTIHLNVSILMWVGMVVSVFVTLTFLPSIIMISRKKPI